MHTLYMTAHDLHLKVQSTYVCSKKGWPTIGINVGCTLKDMTTLAKAIDATDMYITAGDGWVDLHFQILSAPNT